jgi:hypothetical protein
MDDSEDSPPKRQKTADVAAAHLTGSVMDEVIREELAFDCLRQKSWLPFPHYNPHERRNRFS